MSAKLVAGLSIDKGEYTISSSELSDVRAVLADIRATLLAIENKLLTTPIGNLRDAESKLRRVRDAAFPKGYFADAAWDILLDLDQAGRNQQAYVVTDAGIDAKIPHSTALRYLAKLERDGLVQRRPDPGDRRRTFISLTDKGQNLLDGVFAETLI